MAGQEGRGGVLVLAGKLTAALINKDVFDVGMKCFQWPASTTGEGRIML